MEGTQNLAFWILPFATAVGAWGGFPEPPAMWKNLAANELFQWLTVFILTWQGGGGQNMRVSLITTLGLFIVAKLLGMGSPMAMMMPAAPEAAAEEKFYHN